jgi:hypothetical protein
VHAPPRMRPHWPPEMGTKSAFCFLKQALFVYFIAAVNSPPIADAGHNGQGRCSGPGPFLARGGARAPSPPGRGPRRPRGGALQCFRGRGL